MLHHYKQLKDQGLRSELDAYQIEQMQEKCWATLRVVMRELMLAREYEMIEQNYKKKTKPQTKSGIRLRNMKRESREEQEARLKEVDLLNLCNQEFKIMRQGDNADDIPDDLVLLFVRTKMMYEARLVVQGIINKLL